MGLRNGPAEFGLVTRIIHWATMLLVIGQLALGLRISDMQPGLDNLWLYGLHKTIGFAVLALILALFLRETGTAEQGPLAKDGTRPFVPTLAPA